jgi:hypothetical protein
VKRKEKSKLRRRLNLRNEILCQAFPLYGALNDHKFNSVKELVAVYQYSLVIPFSLQGNTIAHCLASRGELMTRDPKVLALRNKEGVTVSCVLDAFAFMYMPMRKWAYNPLSYNGPAFLV